MNRVIPIVATLLLALPAFAQDAPRAAPAIGGPAVSAPEPPAGRWVRRTAEGLLEHYLFPGGRWGSVTVVDGKRTVLAGSWRAEGTTLTLTESGKTWLEAKFSIDAEGRLVLSGPRVGGTPVEFEAGGPEDVRRLPGTWKSRSGPKRTWKIDGSGRLEGTLEVFGRTVPRNGTIRTEGFRFFVRLDGMEGEDAYDWLIARADGRTATADNLVLLGEAAEPIRLDRTSKPPVIPEPGPVEPDPPKPEPEPEPGGVVGRWAAADESGTVLLDLRPDGTYVRELRAAGGNRRVSGTWSAKGSTLLVTDAEENRIRFTFQRNGADELALTVEDTTIVFRRVAGKEPPEPEPVPEPVPEPDWDDDDPPRAMLGKWHVEDVTGAFTLELFAGERFKLFVRSGAVSKRYTGDWYFEDGELELSSDDGELDEILPCRLVGKTVMIVNLEGSNLRLTKMGGGR